MIASASRMVDYFPRGANEAVLDAHDHPMLEIEPRLVFVYQGDLRFYLSPRQAHLKPILEEALAVAARNGVQKRLIEEFYGSAVRALALPHRVRIPLRRPAGE